MALETWCRGRRHPGLDIGVLWRSRRKAKVNRTRGFRASYRALVLLVRGTWFRHAAVHLGLRTVRQDLRRRALQSGLRRAGDDLLLALEHRLEALLGNQRRIVL